MKTVKIAAVAVATSLMASAASAATLGLIGGGYQDQVLANYDLAPDLDGKTIKYLTGDVKDESNGLAASGPAKVTFEFRGSEAGNTNYSASLGNPPFIITESTSIGTKFTQIVSGGLLDFLFSTVFPVSAVSEIVNNSGATPADDDRFAIGYYQDGNSWYALFDDIASGDRDFDDFVLKIDIAPVPLPAAGFLLLGGLGALGAVARRRKAS